MSNQNFLKRSMSINDPLIPTPYFINSIYEYLSSPQIRQNKYISMIHPGSPTAGRSGSLCHGERRGSAELLCLQLKMSEDREVDSEYIRIRIRSFLPSVTCPVTKQLYMTIFSRAP